MIGHSLGRIGVQRRRTPVVKRHLLNKKLGCAGNGWIVVPQGPCTDRRAGEQDASLHPVRGQLQRKCHAPPCVSPTSRVKRVRGNIYFLLRKVCNPAATENALKREREREDMQVITLCITSKPLLIPTFSSVQFSSAPD